MTNKEVIINGVNIFKEIDEWADIVAQSWGTDEYSIAEIIKNYILQCQHKAQECEEWKQKAENEYQCYQNTLNLSQHNFDKYIEANEKVECLQAENEELKKYKYVVDKLAGMQVILTNKDKMPELYENAKDLKLDSYKQGFENIKKIIYLVCGNCILEHSKDCDKGKCFNFTANEEEILTIINEVLKDE